MRAGHLVKPWRRHCRLMTVVQTPSLWAASSILRWKSDESCSRVYCTVVREPCGGVDLGRLRRRCTGLVSLSDSFFAASPAPSSSSAAACCKEGDTC